METDAGVAMSCIPIDNGSTAGREYGGGRTWERPAGRQSVKWALASQRANDAVTDAGTTTREY